MTWQQSCQVIPTKVGIHAVLNAVIPTKVGIHAILNAVIPTKVRIHCSPKRNAKRWIPAHAGMTEPEHPHGR